MNTEDVNQVLSEIEKDIENKTALAQAYRLVAEDMKSRKSGGEASSIGDIINKMGGRPIGKIEKNDGYGSKTNSVRSAIQRINGNFSYKEIMKFCELSKVEVQFILYRLTDIKEIEIVEKGSGRKATIYRAKKS